MSATELRARIRAFLDARRVLTLATTGDDGPWAAAVFFAAGADLRLYFVSDPSTRHAQELAARPRVAATVQDANVAWTGIQGLQIEGRARALAAGERAAAEAVYLARYPEIAALLAAPADGAAATVAARFAASSFYELAPARIRLIDNTRGFGYREELVP